MNERLLDRDKRIVAAGEADDQRARMAYSTGLYLFVRAPLEVGRKAMFPTIR